MCVVKCERELDRARILASTLSESIRAIPIDLCDSNSNNFAADTFFGTATTRTVSVVVAVGSSMNTAPVESPATSTLISPGA